MRKKKLLFRDPLPFKKPEIEPELPKLEIPKTEVKRPRFEISPFEPVPSYQNIFPDPIPTFQEIFQDTDIPTAQEIIDELNEELSDLTHQ